MSFGHTGTRAGRTSTGLGVFIAIFALASSCTPARLPAGRCIFNDDCPSGQICASRSCRVECRSERDCTNGWHCVPSDQPGRNICADPRDPPLCAYAADCVSQDAGAGAVCRGGRCVQQCVDDYECRVLNPHTRCDLTAGSATLNTCVLVAMPRVDAGCADGGVSCRGTCVDLATDTRNCGRCGGDCTRLPGVASDRVRCVAGACDYASACLPGRAHCTTNANDGCESDLSTPMTCGTCTTRCAAPTPYCSPATMDGGGTFTCTSDCAAPRQLCSDSCVDVQTDRRHCGRCDTPCPDAAGGVGTCESGRCTLRCAVGRADCDMAVANGCEADLDRDTRNCGACGTACADRPNARGTCSSGTCGLRCNAGHADCDGNAANGCEADLASDLGHCGSCASACPTQPNAVARCSSGVCSTACSPGFGDCDGAAANGCESPLGSDMGHCGACGRACRSVNGTSRCAMGVCSLVSCDAGAADCDADATNGCEVILAADAANCGSCGARCPTVANGVAACVAGVCGLSCLPGFARVGMACLAAGPRLLSPISGSIAMSSRPSFRFVPPVVSADTRVEVCRDRACTMVVASQVLAAPGGHWPPPTMPAVRIAALPPGTYFWRATGRDGTGTVNTVPSATWEFSVRTMPTGVSTVADTFVGMTDDFNGDGFADMAATFQDGDDVFSYHGGPAGLAVSPSVRSSPGGLVASAGDVNGDGYSDLMARYDGTTSPECMSPGRVVVFHGGPTGLGRTAATVLCPPSSTARSFAATAGALGDFDGDGYGDIVVGNCGTNGAGLGAVCVYLGSPTGVGSTPRLIRAPPDAIAFGLAAAGAADVNGDQVADLVVGSCYPGLVPCSSAAFVYHGLAGSIPTTFARRLEQPDRCSEFGQVVSGGVDVNGDGLGDVVVACNPNLAPAVGFTYHGATTGIDPTPATRMSPIGNSFVAGSFRGIGDLDGDGFGDVSVAVTTFPPSLAIWRGRVSGLPAMASAVLTRADLPGFGSWVAPARDVNRDGRPELVVGAFLTGRVALVQWDVGTSTLQLGTQWMPPISGLYWGTSVALIRRPRHRVMF